MRDISSGPAANPAPSPPRRPRRDEPYQPASDEKPLLLAHGGTLTVESQPGHGATFVMTLPVITAAAVGAVGADDGVTRGSPKSILVVEDEPEIAATLVETLEHDGHTVDVASDGIAALDRVQSAHYDLIITDTKMPRMDGPAFYRELIRRRPIFTRRVVFVTGDLMDRDKREWLESTGCLTSRNRST